jgi:hypothetical protein
MKDCINKNQLLHYLYEQIEIEWSHIEHDEFRFRTENKYCRGKVEAFEQIIKIINGEE